MKKTIIISLVVLVLLALSFMLGARMGTAYAWQDTHEYLKSKDEHIRMRDESIEFWKQRCK